MYRITETEIAGRKVRLQHISCGSRGRYRFYRVLGTYADNGETFSMTQGEFAKWTTALERTSKTADH
jgi:hypothetical protein